MSARNWERMHKGRWAARREAVGLGSGKRPSYGRRFKVRYRFWIYAKFSCWKINRNRNENMRVYLCRFTDTEGEKEKGLKHHWHIGHGISKFRIMFGRARSATVAFEVGVKPTRSPAGFRAHIYLGVYRWFVSGRFD